jgi:putative transposase
MARTSPPPKVSENVRNELLTWARSQKIESRMQLRANIILDWLDGYSYDESKERYEVSYMVISKWRQRFKQEGMAGLKDKPRSGKPQSISEKVISMVLHYACSKPGDGRLRYSQQEIAQKTGISQSKVSEILQDSELRPHKTEYWCGKSPDPEFEKKMLEIVGLYMNPPENALVICVDEKTQIQALDRTQPELPMRSGTPRRLTNTYKRNGTVNLIAALAVQSGEVTAKTMEHNNSENFLKFLKLIDRKYTNVKLHIIVDNLSVHKNKEIQKWLSNKRKIHIHYTPTYSSWLNQIETWFGILTRDVLKDAVWQSKQQLIDQLMEYIRFYNLKRAHPFKWTYAGNTKLT